MDSNLNSVDRKNADGWIWSPASEVYAIQIVSQQPMPLVSKSHSFRKSTISVLILHFLWQRTKWINGHFNNDYL